MRKLLVSSRARQGYVIHVAFQQNENKRYKEIIKVKISDIAYKRREQKKTRIAPLIEGSPGTTVLAKIAIAKEDNFISSPSFSDSPPHLDIKRISVHDSFHEPLETLLVHDEIYQAFPILFALADQRALPS
ncbi:hypothetical protein NPIL_113981 [Nephila pilipes]|uniref:Uncharacterized protein n=1 Tax=Nephila pilipes TaxID=299642 RepID=A0A8X6QZK9_NEPPI|nr:hypothetical protein NPIL_113981 [Nephila pilipes]